MVLTVLSEVCWLTLYLYYACIREPWGKSKVCEKYLFVHSQNTFIFKVGSKAAEGFVCSSFCLIAIHLPIQNIIA